MHEPLDSVPLREIADIFVSNVDKHILPGELHVLVCNYLHVYKNRRLTRQLEYDSGSATNAEITRFGLKKGDVLITKDSETPDDIGVPAVVIEDLINTVCGYHLAILRPKSDAEVDSRFLSLCLQGDNAKRHFLQQATGVTRFGLGIRGIASFPVPTLRAEEQAAIAALLDSVDDTIAKATLGLQESRNLIRAIQQRFFFDALGETAYADRPTKKLPAGWQLLPTGSLLSAEPKNGVSPQCYTEPPGTPTFSIAAVRDGRVDLDTGITMPLTSRLLIFSVPFDVFARRNTWL